MNEILKKHELVELSNDLGINETINAHEIVSIEFAISVVKDIKQDIFTLYYDADTRGGEVNNDDIAMFLLNKLNELILLIK